MANFVDTNSRTIANFVDTSVTEVGSSSGAERMTRSRARQNREERAARCEANSTELARERLRWNRHSCQGFADAHLPLLTPDEQLPVYEEVSKVWYQLNAHRCITGHATSSKIAF